jgi:asparagine synthase (glutamine-hydrolysing)
MSRLAGLATIERQPASGPCVELMLARMARASDESRVACPGNAVLGWCGGGSPRLASVGDLAVAFDGAIFNFREFGHGSSEPASLVLDLVRRRGFEAAIQAINGDFAVAVFDSGPGTLWLARDRVGVKPLYFASQPNGLSFASRPGALLDQGGVSRRVNRRFAALFAASHYRTFDNDPHASPFADIAQLPAAHILEWRAGRVVRLSPYWSLADREEFEGDFKDLAGNYRDLLRDAVKIRFDVARNPAFTLSGGMDSSSVLGCAVESSGAKQHAYSSVYEDKTYDESAEIRSMLEKTVEHWHQVSIGTPDVPGLVARMVRAHDEPVATATWLSHYMICSEVAREGFSSLFGGLGGDELNAGEYEYFFFHFADMRRQGREAELAQEIERWVEYHDHPIYRKSAAVVEAHFRRVVDFTRSGRCLPDRARLDRYLPALDPAFHDLGSFAPVMDAPFGSYLKNRTYQDIFRETAPCCLRAEDRQAAAFGLEHFDPFFDYRLLEFMFRVPGSMKIRQGVTKVLLREAMRDILPEETRTRIKKTGWNAPAHVWFSGANLEWLRDTIASREFAQRGIYVQSELQRILAEHDQIVKGAELRDNHMMFLWQLVNLDAWARELRVEF